MASVSKKEIWEEVHSSISGIFEGTNVSNKIKKEVMSTLERILAPKRTASAAYPDILNEDGSIKESWCRLHQKYEPYENMVISNGKSKGICKAALALWNKTNTKIKKLDSLAVEAMADGDFEEAQKLATESRELKESFNKPEFYDFERDWENFNPSTPIKVEEAKN